MRCATCGRVVVESKIITLESQKGRRFHWRRWDGGGQMCYLDGGVPRAQVATASTLVFDSSSSNSTAYWVSYNGTTEKATYESD